MAAGRGWRRRRVRADKNDKIVEHDVLETERLGPVRARPYDLVSRDPGIRPFGGDGRAWTKNREKQPLQSRVKPGSHTPAALRPGARRKMRRRHGPNLISSRSGVHSPQTKRIKDSPFARVVVQAILADRMETNVTMVRHHAATPTGRGEPRAAVRPLGVMTGIHQLFAAS